MLITEKPSMAQTGHKSKDCPSCLVAPGRWPYRSDQREFASVGKPVGRGKVFSPDVASGPPVHLGHFN